MTSTRGNGAAPVAGGLPAAGAVTSFAGLPGGRLAAVFSWSRP
jgi:hypothetical protein